MKNHMGSSKVRNGCDQGDGQTGNEEGDGQLSEGYKFGVQFSVKERL